MLQALEYLGISHKDAEDIGIRVYKIGMTWPLEPIGIREFAKGLEDIIVVEEKRSFVERQMKEYMYNWEHGARPSIVGKYDEDDNWVLPSTNELTPARIARVIASRLKRFHTSERMDERLRWLAQKEAELAQPRTQFPRVPHYCSGCPHNSSTVVPEGSRALGGIGCHYMVTWMDRKTDTFTHMGGEGVTWAGQAPFTTEKHVFQNLGDGTYFHSGSLAIRQSIAAGVNITYKILYNDAVAMTGGQPVDGTLSVPDIAHQVRSEGVHTIVVLSDDIGKWSDKSIFPSEVEFYDRSELDAQQKRLREVTGVSVLIFDQTCAAEKRRRRKRGKAVDPAKRIFINSLVCEGCGDCGVKSNCVSVLPKETEFGRKREIDQSNCNKDFSCVKGFCPSFVSVLDAPPRKRKPSASDIDFSALPDPVFRSDLSQPWNILITGVGGTGVVTIGALLGMAAHLEHKGGSVLDQTGLAQKGGAVTTHVRIAKDPSDIHAVRIAAGEADLVLGCDQVVVNDYWALSKIRSDRSEVVLNTYEAMPGPFTRMPDMQFPSKGIVEAVSTALGGRQPSLIEATELATALLGDAIASNLFMLGYAWQLGLVPLSFESIDRAIELNGAAVAMNRKAFAWGRLAAIEPDRVREAAGLGGESAPEETQALALDDARLSETLDELIARRVAFLTDYQDAAYAGRYVALVDAVRQAEARVASESTELTRAVARYYFKLMAYKDEYEVARLYTSGEFERRIRQTFEDGGRLRFHLAPPLLAKRDADGHLVKAEYGPWVLTAFRWLAKLRRLRGTALDIFGRTEERRMERQLIEDYRRTIEELLGGLKPERLALATEIASLPEQVRGFGHVKESHVAKVRARWQALQTRWREGLAAKA
ncbi:MAG TPA: indolepyruvate ferredoxin oxidoreductase family protein [Arenimonas sp.]|nr:indolepyruvate ferredoxin oxidoreductase family protein [Arenimonas sp.]